MVKLEELDFIRFCFESHRKVYALPPDTIAYIDLTFCISGMMHYRYMDRDVYLKPGDAILFPQGSVRTRLETNTPAIYVSFNVTVPDSFTPAVSGYLPNSLRSDTVTILESVKNAFKSVSEEKNAKCTALFWYLYYQLVETAANNEHPHIKHIKQYVAEHLSEHITLDQVAESVHLSAQYCCTIFSKYMGQTLFDFITRQKVEYAKSLIITSRLPLAEIAERCGFADYNYFSRVFKNITGITASQYRALSKSRYRG